MLSKHPNRAQLQRLANYLTHDIEVAPAHRKRGILLGLPFVQPWDRPGAVVKCPDSDGPGLTDLIDVHADTLRPVLYDVQDLAAVLAARGEAETADEREAIRILNTMSRWELQRAARLTDVARVLGIALNMPADSYIRKEVRGEN